MKEVKASHIHIILDRTGSMQSIREDTIGGFNAFLKKQQELSGKASLSLIQFDSQDPYEIIHDACPIEDVPELTHETFVPRASTPLLDAIGRGINDLEHGLSSGKRKPEKVVFVIITDGYENASREFNKEDINRMIKEKEEKEDWQFVFLSADLHALRDARSSYGYEAKRSMHFKKSAQGTKDAWDVLSTSMSNYMKNEVRSFSFYPEEEKKQEKEK